MIVTIPALSQAHLHNRWIRKFSKDKKGNDKKEERRPVENYSNIPGKFDLLT